MLVSSAKEDIVVSEPQNPIAINREYFISKFNKRLRTENTPKMKLPIILTIKMFTGIIPPNNIIGKDAILYLRNAPAKLLQQEEQIQ